MVDYYFQPVDLQAFGRRSLRLAEEEEEFPGEVHQLPAGFRLEFPQAA